MTTSSNYLAWTLVLAFVQLIVATIARRPQDGVAWAIGNREEAPIHYTGFAGRMMRAQANLYETLPIFIGVALLAHGYGRETTPISLGAALYFWGRLVYVPVYGIGLPGWRTAVWTVSAAGLVMMLFGVFV